jgi:hypothetical protein
MKNFTKLFGVIAVVAIIGFSTAACDISGGGGGGNHGGDVSGIDTLSLSGRVFFEERNGSGVTYSDFIDSLTIADDDDKSGTVTNGNFLCSVGTPTYPEAIDRVLEDLFGGYNTITSSPASGSVLLLDTDSGYISKTYSTISIRGYSFSSTTERVDYVYVTDDITVSGAGWTTVPETEKRGGVKYTKTYTGKDFNLALKTGWNAIYQKFKESGTFTGASFANPISITSAVVGTVSLGNPDLRWVLNDYEPPFPSPTPLTSGQWAGGTFSEDDTDEVWYSFPVTNRKTYRIWIDDNDNPNTPTTGDVVIRGYYSNGIDIWGKDSKDKDSNWDTPASFTADSDGTVYIGVKPYDGDSYGTYRILYR